MATNGNGAHQEQYSATSGVVESSSAESPNSGLSKDEVGWYFVEQYYTTLSKSPEKLHLFYGKPSQFVYGPEADAAPVSVGRPAIQERIKALEFQDCKVRISNVDSQSSFENIVIQVIGETSNKAGEPKKFVQTFVLAQQPSGYFVLNDILRYIKEESDDYPAESAARAGGSSQAPVMPALEPQSVAKSIETDTSIEEPAQADAGEADKTPEEAAIVAQGTPATSVADTPAEPAEAASLPTATQPEAVSEPTTDSEKPVLEKPEEKTKKPEAAKSVNTAIPAAQPPAPVASEPEQPKEAPKPRTWANLAAAAAGPTTKAVAPASSKVAAPVPAQNRPSGTALPIVPQATPASQATETTTAKEPASEWQTAGADSKRQTRTQSVSGPPQEKDGTLAYVKYVTEKVSDKDLKAHLSTFGDVVYFDISRSKNCAFVEFATPAAYQAAAAANPHTVNGENIIVEARRPKAGAYGGSNYNPSRGSISGRGRGGFDGGRSGSQGSGRGGFGGGQARGRGTGTGAPRGRPSASQAANA